MALRSVRAVRELPKTVYRWWRRTTDAPAGEVAAAFVGLPALLVCLWLLPGTADWEFSLASESVWADGSTLWTAFASSYVHVGAGHLLDNLLNYWVTLFAVYPLVSLAGWRRQFRASALAYLLVAPLVVSWFTLVTLGTLTDQPSVGFSGINAALLGFVPVALFAAADSVTDGDVGAGWSLVPFSLSLAATFALPSVRYFPPQPALAVGFVGVAALAGGLLWRFGGPRRPSRLRRRVRHLSDDRRLAFLIGGTVFAFGVAGALLFVRVGTNVWGHLAGYAFGFAFPYAAFVLLPALGIGE